MFLAIYIFVTLFLNVLSAFVFYKHLHISVLSLLPLSLMVVMLFQVLYYRKGKTEDECSTAYGSDFNSKEQSALLQYASKSLTVGITLLIPFILFFTDIVKTLSVPIYILSFAAGIIYYRINHKDELQNRIQEEKRQLEEQMKKENQGKWK